jgi:23S rRNA pseudouridine1911/1915/1917 synthase
VSETFDADPGRLDAVVARRLQIPRAEAQRAIEQGGVRVEGTQRDRSFRLSGGERIDVDLAPARAVPPEHIPVEVRFVDEHLLVVVKPPGVPTHPTENQRTGTLVNRLLAMDGPLSAQAGPLRPGIVHRLDAGTSGLMLVARDETTHTALSAMLRRHEVDRRYLALVRGAVANDRFIIDAALGRRGARVRVQALAGRAATTAIEVRERFTDATLVEAAPRTGRTHQIRVHLAAVEHPILGDRRYGGGGDDAERLGLSRPFLHSWRIGFDHPVTGARIELEEPLPPDLEHALVRLRALEGN